MALAILSGLLDNRAVAIPFGLLIPLISGFTLLCGLAQ